MGDPRQPTPVFLPGESHGQRSLVGYSPQSHRGGHTKATRHACTCIYTYIHTHIVRYKLHSKKYKIMKRT